MVIIGLLMARKILKIISIPIIHVYVSLVSLLIIICLVKI